MASASSQTSASGRRRRNRQIAATRAAGSTWPEIAKRFSLSERQARRAAREAAQIQSEVLSVPDAERLIVQVVGVQRKALDLLAEMLTNGLDNDASRVGAIRTAGSLGVQIHETLIRSGLLPMTGAEARFTAEMRAAVTALTEAARDLGVDPREVERKLAGQAPLALGVTA
jgi:uncharacterized protein YfcZ (UPF0381/DUF406 family)